jgi:hypothetical protein
MTEQRVSFHRNMDGSISSADGTVTVSPQTFRTAAEHTIHNHLIPGVWERSSALDQFRLSQEAMAFGLSGGASVDVEPWTGNDNFDVAAEIYRQTLNEILRSAAAALS